MANRWGRKSKRVRATLDPRLQIILDELLTKMDISLITGYRGREDQNAAYENGNSQLRYPDSKHNTNPSVAIDLEPYPRPTREVELWAALGYMAGLAKGIAEKHGWKLRWGGDWDGDGDLTDNSFDDLFHLEIVDV